MKSMMVVIQPVTTEALTMLQRSKRSETSPQLILSVRAVRDAEPIMYKMKPMMTQTRCGRMPQIVLWPKSWKPTWKMTAALAFDGQVWNREGNVARQKLRTPHPGEREEHRD